MFLITDVRLVDGTTLGVLVLSEKTFRSGKTGFFGQAKITHKGQRYQAQCQLVEIKPKQQEATR